MSWEAPASGDEDGAGGDDGEGEDDALHTRHIGARFRALKPNHSSGVTLPGQPRPSSSASSPSAKSRQARSTSAARKSTASRALGELARDDGELVDPRCELRLPLVGVQIGRERLDGPVVDAELAVRIAARREQEHRAAPRLVQLAFGQLDPLPGEVGEDGQRVAELAAVDAPRARRAQRSTRDSLRTTDSIRTSRMQADERTADHIGDRVRRLEHEQRPDEGRPDAAHFHDRVNTSPIANATITPRIMWPLGNESSKAVDVHRNPVDVPVERRPGDRPLADHLDPVPDHPRRGGRERRRPARSGARGRPPPR